MSKELHPTAFRPTTSANSDRYERTSRVKPTQLTVPPGLYSYAPEPEPRYLPALWSAHSHPEGNVYFVRNTIPRVVTDAHMWASETQEVVAQWIDVMDGVLRKMDIRITEYVELYLKLVQGGEACEYYFVNHETRVEFWLEPVDVELLDLEGAVSDEHLRHALEEHYWNHVEQFPSHDPYGLDTQLPLLTDIMIQGRADQLMSTTSTFPYSAQECSNFIDLIKTSRDLDRIHSPHTRWSVARLWSMICHHRFSIHSGQEHCRLSRDQTILDLAELRHSLAYTAADHFLFSTPSVYNRLLEDLWVDQLAYVNQWQPFIKSCKEEWTMVVALTFAVMMCNLLLLVGSLGSRSLAYASIMICNIGILSTVRLLIQHQRSAFDTSKEAASYLSDWHSEKHGFKTTAFLFSLPRALLLWALGVSSFQSVVWLAGVFPRRYIALATIVLVVFGLSCFAVLSLRKWWKKV